MITLAIHCDECVRSLSVPFLMVHPHAALLRKAAVIGWSIVNNGDHNLCPSCIARAEQEAEANAINR